jgi:hypothetical protein
MNRPIGEMPIGPFLKEIKFKKLTTGDSGIERRLARPLFVLATAGPLPI